MLRLIEQTNDEVTLVFDGDKKITFIGYVFSTANSPLNKEVLCVIDSATVGIKALMEIRKNGGNVRDYQQMILMMEDGTEKEKCELIVAYKIENKLRSFLIEFINL